MQWDLGIQGLGVLLAMSAVFAVVAQLVAARATTRRLWLIAGGAFFLGGLVASEWLFGWATEEELQPNIDGLSFDEALLFGLLFGIPAVLTCWLVARRQRHAGPALPAGPRGAV